MFRYLSRRNFFRTGLTASASVSVSQFLATSAGAAEGTLPKSTRLLFQGDSITDAGRDRRRAGPNQARGFGQGYPLLITAKLLADNPAAGLQGYNRGISGNKVPDLDQRWQKDCIELAPTILSVLIGVNDIWHKLNGKFDGSVATYEQGLEALLKRTREALPDVRLVVCEPFVLRCGAVNDKWFPEFDERRAACHRVAEKLNCTWIPFQTMFDVATTDETPPQYWAGDGVHPTMAGHALMAKTWLERVFPPADENA